MQSGNSNPGISSVIRESMGLADASANGAQLTRSSRGSRPAVATPERSLKVLLVNYRYFVSGGPERYLFNVTDLLERNGHSVAPFSITYEQNEPTPYAEYFASPIADPQQVYFRDHRRDIRSVVKATTRAVYSPEVYKKLATLIDDVKPDVALVLHYLRKLSPSVLKCLHDKGVPFVVRMSDYGMLCPSAHLFRNGAPCELCAMGSLRNSIRHRCVQGSLAASVVNYAATRFHEAAGFYDLIPRFVVPSRFLLEKMAASGFARQRLVHVPTFVASNNDAAPIAYRRPVVTFVGRLDELKGAHVLLEAARLLADDNDTPVHEFRIVGNGEPGYTASLREFAHQHRLTNVSFSGPLGAEGVRDALRNARCSVAPSLWYDNMPNSVLESFAEGTPVVAPDHGCFPELITDGESGRLFRPGDARSLADALKTLLREPDTAAAMGGRARAFAADQHSPQLHYDLLMKTFDDVRREKLAA